jgi:hypothetical protein
MAQITVRAEEELVARVKASARRSGRSMNEFVVRVLDAATDPDLAGDEAARVHERLAAAGLLHPGPWAQGAAPPAAAVAAARRRAGDGTPLSDLIAEDRR